MAWHHVNGRILDAQIATALGARMPRILIVEDHAAFRGALAFLLEREQDREVTAVVGSLARASDALGGAFDVAVIDPVLPDGDGIELIGELQRSSPGVCVLVLSATVERGGPMRSGRRGLMRC
jgi:DNA-binding NarL/FixJ family response regulator